MIESAAAAASKEEEERPSQPPGDHTPSHPVTSEPEKANRAERPLSSEYGSPKGQITVHAVAMFLSIVLYLLFFFTLCSVFMFFTSVSSSCCGLK